MKRILSSVTPLTGGLMMAVLFVIEFYTGISNSVGYVLIVLVTLWNSWNHPRAKWAGVAATVFIFAGFFVVHYDVQPAIPINRIMALVTIWIALFFAYRYRTLFEAEEVQKRQLGALFEHATEGMIFTDSLGQIVRINPAAEQIFGYEKGELMGKAIEALVPERLADAHSADRQQLYQNPTDRRKSGRELLARRKNGSEFIAEISLSHFFEREEIFYIAFVMDISERKRQEAIIQANVNSTKKLNEALDAKVRKRTAELESALNKLEFTNSKLTTEIAERKKIEARLIQSKLLYTAIAKNFPEGVIGVLDKEFRYVLAEGRELERIGYRGASPIGQRIFDVEDKSLVTAAEEKMIRVFGGEAVSFDVDIRNNVYNLIAVPLPDIHNRVSEILVVMKNVTDRKMIERKLVRTIEKEKELSALKSRFVTMASHEFRTPLSTMLSSVFLLQNYTGDKYESQKKTHLDRIRRSIQTLTELMNDFLSIGQLEEGQIKTVFTPVDVRVFLEEIVADMNPIKKVGQVIQVQHLGDAGSVLTDRQMLTNILRNLLSNAVKYSPPDTVIEVVSTFSDGKMTISVQDHGIGIPEHEQADIFKRFYRAENVTNIQGTGLGLNIVRKYVKLLNGTIDFSSKLNEGTTFTVRIPAAAAFENKKSQLIP